jgi:UDP-glucose 4-epimerase
MRFLITGGAGFIGSHLANTLFTKGHEVYVVDNLQSGFVERLNNNCHFYKLDINDFPRILEFFTFNKFDGVFHMAAIARTPWCIEDPILASQVNGTGTACVLEASRQSNVKRVVLSSSNVVYAAQTPYRITKEMVEMWGKVYTELYGLSVISLRYSNVYGDGQSEIGPSPNVFASFRKTLRNKGYIEITGDGEQTRDFTHVSDIVYGNMLAMESSYEGVLDLCTGHNWSMNYIVKEFFKAEARYIPERVGDMKHIIQDPKAAKEILGWVAKIALPDGIKTVLDCAKYLKCEY